MELITVIKRLTFGNGRPIADLLTNFIGENVLLNFFSQFIWEKEVHSYSKERRKMDKYTWAIIELQNIYSETDKNVGAGVLFTGPTQVEMSVKICQLKIIWSGLLHALRVDRAYGNLRHSTRWNELPFVLLEITRYGKGNIIITK